MFRAHVLIVRRTKIVLCSLWYHHTCRWPSGAQTGHGTATYRCDDTRDCIIQFCPPDDVHMCSNHVEAWNKLIIKFSASSWLILINEYIEMHGQQNIKTHFFCFGDAQTNNCISAKIFILLTYVEIITIHLFGTRHNVLCVKARKNIVLFLATSNIFYHPKIPTLGPSQPPIWHVSAILTKGTKRPDLESYHSSPYSAENKSDYLFLQSLPPKHNFITKEGLYFSVCVCVCLSVCLPLK